MYAVHCTVYIVCEHVLKLWVMIMCYSVASWCIDMVITLRILNSFCVQYYEIAICFKKLIKRVYIMNYENKLISND